MTYVEKFRLSAILQSLNGKIVRKGLHISYRSVRNRRTCTGSYRFLFESVRFARSLRESWRNFGSKWWQKLSFPLKEERRLKDSSSKIGAEIFSHSNPSLIYPANWNFTFPILGNINHAKMPVYLYNNRVHTINNNRWQFYSRNFILINFIFCIWKIKKYVKLFSTRRVEDRNVPSNMKSFTLRLSDE